MQLVLDNVVPSSLVDFVFELHLNLSILANENYWFLFKVLIYSSTIGSSFLPVGP